MLKKLLRVNAVVSAFLIALSPSTTIADSGMTITLGATGELVARVAVIVPIEISCTSLAPRTVFSENFIVSVQQAFGTETASGNAFIGAFFPGPFPITCDGSTQELQVTVVANPFGPPFHGGPALVSAFGSVCAGFPSPFGFFFDTVCNFGSAGPAQILFTGR